MLISLKEWAARVGIDSSTARQKAGRGMLKTAVKIGRDWLIDEDEKNVDHRFKRGNPKDLRTKKERELSGDC